LTEKYDIFVKFINELTTEGYFCSNKGKWVAKQGGVTPIVVHHCKKT
jgi:heptaprenylglyceryl phosphate synthase